MKKKRGVVSLFAAVLILSLGFVLGPSLDVKADPAHENVDNNAVDSDADCTYCHGKDVMSRPDPNPAVLSDVLIDPDTHANNPPTAYAGSTDKAFCLACHDSAAPTGVVFVNPAEGWGYNKSGYSGSVHDTQFNNNDCRYCHTMHGPGSEPNTNLRYSRIKDNYRKGGTSSTYLMGNFQLCWNCHSEPALTGGNNSFGSTNHDRHVTGNWTAAACIMCHDAHGPYDAGEPGNINFYWAASNGYLTYTGGRNASTSFYISGNTGYCYVNCHGMNHSPESYSRSGDTTTTTGPY